MNIKFISDCVDGKIPLDELEIVCVPKKKHAEVDLCIKGSALIPFAKIKLFDTDRWVDAEESFEAASALGEEIVRAFNERLSRSPDKRRRGQEVAKPQRKSGSGRFVRGATVRQYHDSSRSRFDDAVITCVHGNGALDVEIDGVQYGWSENFCEVVNT